MIRLEDVSVTYPGADEPALRGVTARVEEGELCLVVGPTGSGKSTLLGAASGRVPHFTGGLLEGRVVVDGRDRDPLAVAPDEADLPRHADRARPRRRLRERDLAAELRVLVEDGDPAAPVERREAICEHRGLRADRRPPRAGAR